MTTPDGSMSDYSFDGGTDVQVSDPTGSTNSGHNPAWTDVLNVLPEQFHGMVTPHFQKWDAAANQRIESVNQQYADYKPFVEHGISQSEIVQGLRLMQELNQNPRSVYDALVQAYPDFAQQVQQIQANAAVQQMTNNDQQQFQQQQQNQQQFQDPRYDRLQQGVEIMAKMLLDQQQAETNSRADAELDSELNQLRTKYGDYDEKFVLSYMNAGYSGEQAVQQYKSIHDNILNNNPRPFAPQVMGNRSGAGAGVPSNAIDVTKLNSKDTRSLVAQMLASAAQQNG